MRYYYTSVCFFFAFLCHSQNYLDETCVWRTYYGSYTVPQTFIRSTIFFNGTETIGDKVYYKQYTRSLKATIYNGNSTVEEYMEGPVYVREDASGIFWKRGPWDSSESAFFSNQTVLNATVGSVIGGEWCAVQTVETVALGSQLLKRIKGNGNFSYSGWVEGVGKVGRLCISQTNMVEWINCFTKGSETIQFTDDLSCDQFPPAEELAISEIKRPVAVIYPNPTSGTAILKSDLIGQHYCITDVGGRKVGEGSIEDVQHLLDISGFPSGVYWITIKGQKSLKLLKI